MPGDGLILGGIEISCAVAVLAHSDGDVVLHALTDAVLGAAAAGDIGEHFPDDDPRWKDVASARFLETALTLAGEKGLRPVNCDITVIADTPRLSGWKDKIGSAVATLLGISPGAVSVKAKTGEGTALTDGGSGIAAMAVVLLETAG